MFVVEITKAAVSIHTPSVTSAVKNYRANAQGDSLEQARSSVQQAVQLVLEANECFNP